jgi:hypothetical protein
MTNQIGCCIKIKSITLFIAAFDLMIHMMILATIFAAISDRNLANSYSNAETSSFRHLAPLQTVNSKKFTDNLRQASSRILITEENDNGRGFFSSLFDFPPGIEFSSNFYSKNNLRKITEKNMSNSQPKNSITLNNILSYSTHSTNNNVKNVRLSNGYFFLNHNLPFRRKQSISFFFFFKISINLILHIYFFY